MFVLSASPFTNTLQDSPIRLDHGTILPVSVVLNVIPKQMPSLLQVHM